MQEPYGPEESATGGGHGGVVQGSDLPDPVESSTGGGHGTVNQSKPDRPPIWGSGSGLGFGGSYGGNTVSNDDLYAPV